MAFPSLLEAGGIDRIAVTIGTHVIAESELVRYIRVAAFLDERPAEINVESKRQAAARLVDQYLILEEAATTRTMLAGENALPALRTPIRGRYVSEAEFRAALAKALISERDLDAHLLAGMRLLQFTDARFRPEVQISEEYFRAYFEDLRQEAERRGTTPPSLDKDREALMQLLTNQLSLEALDRWLAMTRQMAAVVYREAAFK